jgi:hypothetical protein
MPHSSAVQALTPPQGSLRSVDQADERLLLLFNNVAATGVHAKVYVTPFSTAAVLHAAVPRWASVPKL